jgi:hypothetical protein
MSAQTRFWSALTADGDKKLRAKASAPEFWYGGSLASEPPRRAYQQFVDRGRADQVEADNRDALGDVKSREVSILFRHNRYQPG